jgi:predicted acetyltransferase
MPPSVDLARTFAETVQDYRNAGEDFDRFLTHLLNDLPAYVQFCENMQAGKRLPRGVVPQSTYWLIRGGHTLVGSGRVRHQLNAALEKEGGHIGYTIRPSYRRRGYGSRICRLLMDKARDEQSLDKVLITCDTDNTASYRIILKNGGVRVGESRSDYSGKPVTRFWAPT